MVGHAAGTLRGARGDRLPRRALPLPGLGERRGGAAPAPAARRLGGRGRRARRAARAGRPARRRDDGGCRRCRRGCSSGSGSPRRWSASPRLLLLDEPTSALDPAGRRVVRELLAEVRSRGISVLLSSHLLGEVERVCDRVAILVGGEVVERGTPAELARPRGSRSRPRAGTQAARGRRARGRAADRRRAGRARASRSTASGCWRARSRTSISRRSGRIARRSERAEPRRVEAPIDAPTRCARSSASPSPRACGARCSPSSSSSRVVFLVLFGLGVEIAFNEVADGA